MNRAPTSCATETFEEECDRIQQYGKYLVGPADLPPLANAPARAPCLAEPWLPRQIMNDVRVSSRASSLQPLVERQPSPFFARRFERFPI